MCMLHFAALVESIFTILNTVGQFKQQECKKGRSIDVCSVTVIWEPGNSDRLYGDAFSCSSKSVFILNNFIIMVYFLN